jgi:hypothetical protein
MPGAPASSLVLPVPSRVAAWRSGTADLLRRLRRNPLSVVGLGLIVFFALVAILAPVLAPPPAGHPGLDPGPART